MSTADKWWDDFFKLSCDLYPNGPSQNAIWDRAGGSVAILKTNGNAIEI